MRIYPKSQKIEQLIQKILLKKGYQRGLFLSLIHIQICIRDRDYRDIDSLEKGCYWFKQGHIFKNPFYYIDYVLAQVCAFQFLNKSNEDFKKAWDDYINICKIGGTKSFLEIVEIGNLESPFEENTMKNISQKVGALLENIKDSDL